MSNSEVNTATDAPKDVTPTKSVWLRGLFMIITAFLIGAAQSVLFLLALIQFLLMLLSRGTPNAQIADFGDVIAKWLVSASKFQTAKSDEKPWPLGPLT